MMRAVACAVLGLSCGAAYYGHHSWLWALAALGLCGWATIVRTDKDDSDFGDDAPLTDPVLRRLGFEQPLDSREGLWSNARRYPDSGPHRIA